jgi:hypothetical protein
MIGADYKGASAEDRYTVLSYHLLKQTDELKKLLYSKFATEIPPKFKGD